MGHLRSLGVGMLLLCIATTAYGQGMLDQARQIVESATSAPVAQRADEPNVDVKNEFDEGLFEDVKPADPANKPSIGDPSEPPTPSRRLTIDAVVVVDYLFFHSSERFKVKYHLNLGGEIPQDVSVLKGSAKISTDVSGYLAKWATGQCLLKISIAEVPYEITFKKNGDNQADVAVKFPQPIMEDWESLCTFIDDANAKFNTRGNPEKWIADALEKATPSLNKLAAPLSGETITTLKFAIAKHTVKDENIGSAEIDGAGAITIQPTIPDKTAAAK